MGQHKGRGRCENYGREPELGVLRVLTPLQRGRWARRGRRGNLYRFNEIFDWGTCAAFFKSLKASLELRVTPPPPLRGTSPAEAG